VVPGCAVEPADGGVLEGADRSDLRGFKPLRAGELRQSEDCLITRIAHHDVGDDVRVFDNLGFHGRLRNDGLQLIRPFPESGAWLVVLPPRWRLRRVIAPVKPLAGTPVCKPSRPSAICSENCGFSLWATMRLDPQQWSPHGLAAAQACCRISRIKT